MEIREVQIVRRGNWFQVWDPKLGQLTRDPGVEGVRLYDFLEWSGYKTTRAEIQKTINFLDLMKAGGGVQKVRLNLQKSARSKNAPKFF